MLAVMPQAPARINAVRPVPPARSGGALAGVRRLAGAVRDVLLPPQCLGCGALVECPDTLCPACWSAIRFITPPFCDACGAPFEYDSGVPLCASCAARPPPFERARSAVRYDAASKALILAFKHGDRTEANGLLAGWMVRAAPNLLAESDVIVPVPLDRWRLLRRRYNQAGLLAAALGRRTGKPVAADAMARVKPAPKRARRSRRERLRAVAGAFAVQERMRPFIEDRRVLLVDDVLTTGATARAATRALRNAGARAVDVLTFARVPGPGG